MPIYEDINSAMTVIEDRLLSSPPPTSEEQVKLERDYDVLLATMGQLASGILNDKIGEISAAAAKLEEVVRKADRDPIASYLKRLSKASSNLDDAISGSGKAPAGSPPDISGAAAPVAAVAKPMIPVASRSGVSSAKISFLQEATIKAIVNVFETSLVRGDYANITLIKGDSGGLTYGRSQTTLNAGGLSSLLNEYCSDATRPLFSELSKFLPQVDARDNVLNSDLYFHNLLRSAADYPVMREVQDRFFDRFYWLPALAAATRIGVQTALGLAIIYDSYLHGSLELIERRTNREAGLLKDVGEHRWTTKYVALRHQWLAGHPRSDLHATVYRTEALRSLIENELWDLPLPLVVRGAEISAASLNSPLRRVFDGPPVKSRDLVLGASAMAGMDVRQVQVRLSAHDFDLSVKADGIFGQSTMRAVQKVQLNQQCPQTGIVDRSLFEKLGF